MKHHTASGYLPVLLILIQSLLYGFGDPISKIAFDALPVYTVLSIRYSLAAVCLLLFGWKRILDGLKSCPAKVWLLPSICIAGSCLISNVALGMASATSVAFLRSLATVMTPLLAFFVYQSRPRWQHIPVQIMVVVGLYLLCGLGGLSGFGLGEILALVAAFMMAGSLVFGGSALQWIDPITLTTVQAAACAVAAAVCAWIFDGGWHVDGMTPVVFGIIAYLAILCTLAGYLLQNEALKSISARTVALLQCICPVMTAVCSYVILSERLSAAGMAGCAIILACVAAETLIRE